MIMSITSFSMCSNLLIFAYRKYVDGKQCAETQGYSKKFRQMVTARRRYSKADGESPPSAE